jgi:geranylgeranyl diphosphate synthase, type III
MKSRTKSFDYTLQILNNLEKQTRDEIARLGGNPQLEAWMDALKVTPEMIGLSEPSLHQQ